MMLRAHLSAAVSVLLLYASGCGGGGGNASAPLAAQVSVAINPTVATVATDGTQQFTATVLGTTNTAVTWAVPAGSSAGTISTTGLYTAPSIAPNPAQARIAATSQADPTKSASATVSITGIGVQVTPAAVTLQVSGTQSFSANVTGTTNTAVNWSVTGGSGNGTITPSGSYTAPPTVPTPAQVIVVATSQADPAKTGTATVTVITPPPSISVSPNPLTLGVFGSQQFSASTSNLSSNAVTWQVNGVTGGNQQSGFISSTGLYVAPGGVPTVSNGMGQTTPAAVTITAVSQVNPSVSGSATVTLANTTAQNSSNNLGASGSNQNDSRVSGNLLYCCGGTLGALVTRGGTQYILSNNHVLARSDLGTKATGTTPGDNIIEPGLIDSNCGQAFSTTAGHLTDFYNLENGAPPRIDAAIAQLAQGATVDVHGQILYLGATTDANNIPVPGGPNAGAGLPESNALVGRGVAKSGRTTGLTCSSIFSVGTTITVQYAKGCNLTASFSETFTQQIMVDGGSFSAPGDSGSLIVTQDTADPVALLFAGSDQNTAGNPVGPILSFFQSGSNAMTFVGGGPHQVIGCTLPARPASTAAVVPVSAVSSDALERAAAVRAAYASELLKYPEVEALGLAASQDHPGEPAIVFFVRKGSAQPEIPQAVEGVRTRIIEGEWLAERGILSPEQSAALEPTGEPAAMGYAISDSEYTRAKAVHAAHVDAWMSKPGVQGVGIGSSADAPGEAALVIFLVRGVAHEPIPASIDGLRTRVREASPFIAGFADEPKTNACPGPTPRRKQK